MSGPPPKPPDVRRNRNPKMGGEWTHAPGWGWQHGRKPEAPKGLGQSARAAWKTWLGSWPASFWQKEDVPMLRRLIRLYDECDRGENRHGELRQLADRFGLTPRSRQMLRWLPPMPDFQFEEPDPDVDEGQESEVSVPSAVGGRRRRNLHVV